MRKHIIEQVAGETEPDDPTAVARELMVENFGPRTAAWLVMKHRKHFHMRGVFDFKIPAKPTTKQAEKLRWFFVAMEFLKRRAGWSVEVIAHRRIRRFRVRWLSWPHWGVQRELTVLS